MLCKCPQCDSGMVRRKRKKGMLRLIPFLKFYSCFKCRLRFFSFNIVEKYLAKH